MNDLTTDDLIWIEREAMQHRKDGNVSEAVRLYRQLLAKQPDWENGVGFYNLASCYEDLGEILSARSAYLKALVFAPEDTLILGGYASFLLRYGFPEEALDAHLRLLRAKFRAENRKDLESTTKVILELAEKTGIPGAIVEEYIQPSGK
jgi:tetratricopeptide (TPR) repeat protein